MVGLAGHERAALVIHLDAAAVPAEPSDPEPSGDTEHTGPSRKAGPR